MKKSILFTFLNLFIFSQLIAQTTLLTEDFETDGEGSRYNSTTFDDCASITSDYFLRTNVNPYSCANGSFGDALLNLQGSNFWVSEDIDGAVGNSGGSAASLELNPLVASGYSGITVSVFMATGQSDGTRWDTGDFVRIQTNWDGGSYTTIGQFVGDNEFGGYLRGDTNLDGVADGAAITTTFTNYTFNVPGIGTNLFVRIVLDGHDGSEEFAFDHIVVQGSSTPPPNFAPLLANIEVAPFTYTEGDAATQVSNAITITDPDDVNLESAVIQICSGFNSGEDVLSFTPAGGITGSYTSGVLTLTGTSSVANYQAALRSVTYQNTNTGNPSNTQREICFTVNDGTDDSNTQSRSIGIMDVISDAVCLPFAESFESDGEGVSYVSNTFNDSPSPDFFFRINTKPDGHTDAVSGIDGSFFWASEDIMGGSNGAVPGIIEFAPMIISGFDNFTFQILAGISNDNGARWDQNDNIKIQYNIDGGGWITFGLFQGDDPFGGNLKVDTDNDPATPGPYGTTVSNGSASNFSFNINGETGDELKLRILFEQQGGSEELVIDNIRFDGTVDASTIITAQPENQTVCPGDPAAFSVTTNSNGLDFQWQEDSGGGFTNLTDGGNISGANSSSLSLAAATAAMNGNQYRVIISSSDGCGFEAISDAAQLNSLDTEAPSITCPANITVENDLGECGAVVHIPDPTFSDNCPGATFSYSPASGSFFAVGTTQVTATATDASGNFAQCNFDVTVNDTEPPVLTCLPAYTLELDANGEGSFNVFTAGILVNQTDNCGTVGGVGVTGPGTYTCDYLGDHTVTIIQDDAAGNEARCSFILTVTDPLSACNQPPVAVCQNITIPVDDNCLATITAGDVDGGSSDPDGDVLTYSLNTYGPFSPGVHQVELTVSDGEFQDNCTAMVTVVDGTPPTISVPADVTLECSDPDPRDNISRLTVNSPVDIAGAYNTGFALFGPQLTSSVLTGQIQLADDGTGVVTDACDGALADLTGKIALIDRGNCNFIVKVLNAENAGAIAVIVVNNQGAEELVNMAPNDPYATSIPAVFVSYNTGQQIKTALLNGPVNVSLSDPNIDVSDNCNGPVLVTYERFIFDIDCAGSFTRFDVWTARDANGNAAEGVQTINVSDNTAPELTGVPDDETVGSSNVPAYPEVFAFDNCDPDVGVSFSQQNIPGDCAENYTLIRTWTATDDCGNSTEQSQTITVVDDILPTITIPADITLECSDDDPKDISRLTINSPSDIAGEYKTGYSFFGPQLTSAAITGDVQLANDGTGVLTDACDGILADLTGKIALIDRGSCTFVSKVLNAQNAGAIAVIIANNTGTDETINMQPTDPFATSIPVIMVSYNTGVALKTALQSGAVNVSLSDPRITVSDNCGGPLFVTLESFGFQGDCANNFTLFDIYTVTDAAGNFASATQIIDVTDNTAPLISGCPATDIDIPFTDAGQCYYTAGNAFDVLADDNCSDVSYLTYELTGATIATGSTSLAGVQFNYGATTVVWTATDDCGNSSTCTFVVNVNNVQAVATVTVNPTSQQYSDLVEFEATIEPWNCLSDQPGDVVFYVGTQAMGAPVAIGADGKAKASYPLAEIPTNSSNGQMSPGVKTVMADFINTDPAYSISDPTTDLTITQENANVEYVGVEFQATGGSNSSQATVELRAVLQSVPDGAGLGGDIRNACVYFDIAGTTVGPLTPELIDPTDLTTGAVVLLYDFNIGSADFESYDVKVTADCYFVGEDQTVITVYKPVGDFITGGGHIKPTNSAGTYASSPDLKTNFGFHVKFNKKGKNLIGGMNIIFRQMVGDEIQLFQIKTNAMSSLGINIAVANEQTAEFVSKANLKNLTTGEGLGGNLTLQVKIIDRGEPGENDEIAITLWDRNTLLYSSEWTGLKTDLQYLAGGNTVVHAGFSLKEGEITTGLEEIAETFDIEMYPNPTKGEVTLKINAATLMDSEVVVRSITGSEVFRKEYKATELIKIDLSEYVSGIYLVSLQTGDNTVVKKLILDRK